jgi:undecaprenyl-diphosphatase
MLDVLQNLDEGLLLAIQGLRVPILNPLMVVYTKLGNLGILWIALSLTMLCRKSTRNTGRMALLALALGLLCTNVVLKHLVGRPRPWLHVMGLIPLINETDPYSFPSGHTCAAFAAGMIWAKALPQTWMRVLAVVLAVLMGLSRLYVGVHYPSDVLAGAIIGSLSAAVAWKLGQLHWK